MPTIRRCCIVGCLSNSRQNPQLQFFQFPKPDNPFNRLWKEACKASLSRILPFKKPVVCAMHFNPNCIGGRRLTSSAVPSLRLEVPSNLKAVEQQMMVEEIERSRKYAYINAVVYEWLVRANLNPQLRGSITHGMIKEKAESAKEFIGSTTFWADNRWLNRFRDTHLTGFAQKLTNNQLKPLGPSLWIPDIIEDLQHLFPPTNADSIANFENLPEQYIHYMQQYDEFQEDDDIEQSYEEQQRKMHYQVQQQKNNLLPLSKNQEHRFELNKKKHRRSSPYYIPEQKTTHIYQTDSNNGCIDLHSSSDYIEDLTNSSDHESSEEINGITNGHSNVIENDKTEVRSRSENDINEKDNFSSGNITPKSFMSGAPSLLHDTDESVVKANDSSQISIHSYTEALQYLKTLEDFVLFQEDFRAIALISQLERTFMDSKMILKRSKQPKMKRK